MPHFAPLVAVALACVACVAADDVPLVHRSTTSVDDSTWPRFNMASFDQDKIVTFGDYQYTLYWDEDKSLKLVRRRLGDDAVQILPLPYTLTIDPNDGHRNTVVGISAGDGRLHLSWDHHCNPLRYTRSRAGFLTAPPEALTLDDFEPAQPLLPDDEFETRVTYPRFLSSGDGTLFFIYRQGGSGNGDTYVHRYDDVSGTWARMGTTPLFSRRGTYPAWDDSPSRNAYMNDILFDANGRLHVTWTYREASRTWASNHDVHYAYSDDGGITWRNNVGTQVADLQSGDPIELADPGLVVQPVPVYSWMMNQTTMALDSRRQPHVITFKLPEPRVPEVLEHSPPGEWTGDFRMYHYWRDEAGAWHDSGPVAAMNVRPGVIFDSRDTLIVYYRQAGGIRCHTSSADEGWSDWATADLSIPGISIVNAGKPDRLRAVRDDVLSFAAVTDEGEGARGFTIVDFDVPRP